jgi:hypothetical protein
MTTLITGARLIGTTLADQLLSGGACVALFYTERDAGVRAYGGAARARAGLPPIGA